MSTPDPAFADPAFADPAFADPAFADPAFADPAFADLAGYAASPRLTALAVSPDGSRLVASLQQPDAKGAKYVSSLWEIPLDGGEPVRLTRSEQGESSPAFTPAGDLLFTSSRPEPDGEDTDDAALWSLGPVGEPVLVARRAGGVGGPVVARDAGTVLVGGSRLARTRDDADDAERRATRKDRKINAILHTGMPIRYWDHELDDVSPRLFALDGEDLRDLAPKATTELVNAQYSISADGGTAVTGWQQRGPRGRTIEAYAVINVASGELTVRLPPDGADYAGATLSPDASRIAVSRERVATFDVPVGRQLELTSVGDSRTVELGDLWPTEWAWSTDSSTLYVSGDHHGRGAVVAVDAATGTVTHRLADDAVYGNLLPAPDGSLYALRSTMSAAPHPVRLDTAATDQQPALLPTPAPTPPLPGTVEELWHEGVHAYLFTPPGDGPHPVMQWIHGGPFMSYNSWSWRWNPWVAVAHGWAVILPDPALSTGYGQQCIDRAWPYLADVVWREVESVLDHVLQRPELDESRTALLGASFGGFMTNWIAGHTDRFAAIVTHAGLWALDQQHATTDAADYKTGVFGRLAEHPGWYADYSPHNFVDAISTPMLISHGNRDYRVPVSEALRLWWDLVSRWDGDPTELPHRFLQLTGENHWVLSPANAEIWYDSVLGFCGQHVLGRHWEPSPLL